jgi:hypothetical protein
VTRNRAAQALVGLIVIAVGVCALLAQLGVVAISWGALWATWWPLLIVAVAVLSLATNPRAYGGALLFLALGVLLQVHELYPGTEVWGLLIPGLIIVIGLALVMRVVLGDRSNDAASVRGGAFFRERKLATTSMDFRGGAVTTVFGGIKLDLRGADIREAADLSAFAVLGGIEVKVPAHWRVETSGLPILGGWENKAKHPAGGGGPVLRVRATCVLGGVEIRR